MHGITTTSLFVRVCEQLIPYISVRRISGGDIQMPFARKIYVMALNQEGGDSVTSDNEKGELFLVPLHVPGGDSFATHRRLNHISDEEGRPACSNVKDMSNFKLSESPVVSDRPTDQQICRACVRTVHRALRKMG